MSEKSRHSQSSRTKASKEKTEGESIFKTTVKSSKRIITHPCCFLGPSSISVVPQHAVILLGSFHSLEIKFSLHIWENWGSGNEVNCTRFHLQLGSAELSLHPSLLLLLNKCVTHVPPCSFPHPLQMLLVSHGALPVWAWKWPQNPSTQITLGSPSHF